MYLRSRVLLFPHLPNEPLQNSCDGWVGGFEHSIKQKMKRITSLRHLILYSIITIQVFVFCFCIYTRFCHREYKDYSYISIASLLGFSSYIALILWCYYSVIQMPILTKRVLIGLFWISIGWILFFSLVIPAVT